MDWRHDCNLRNELSQLITAAYNQAEVLLIMSKEFRHYPWSLSTLQRRLRYFGLKRNDASCTMINVINCVKKELEGTGRLLGYRRMYHKKRVLHGVRVQVQQMRKAMSLLDPEGVRERAVTNTRKKFQRRVFTSKGPNWVWSFDGHDKLMGYQKSEFP